MIKTPSRGPLWKVSVSTTPEAEDAVAEMLVRLFGQPASIYADLEKQTTVASVFLPRFEPHHRASVRQALRNLAAAGLNLGRARLSARRIPRENWAESWKRHFKPLEISRNLLVLPSWSRVKPKPGQAVVVLDPGLSFGTGHHATTGFCLAQLALRRRPGTAQSLLDAGCGSGILAIAANKLGYSPVMAFDFDPDAVRVAKENAAVNAVAINISRHDLTKLPVAVRKPFDVVCANLMYDLLIQERDRLLARLAPAGTLVLAGILQQQFPAVRRAYEEAGLKLVAQKLAGEWRSGAFQFRL